MGYARPDPAITRRQALAVAAGGVISLRAMAAVRTAGVERVRYLDPGTEFELQRLTDPKSASMLPAAHNLVVSRRQNSLVYASDRSGSVQGWLMHLKSWQNREITEATHLDPDSLTFTPDERNVCYLDGEGLWLTPASGAKGRKLADGATPKAGITVVPDGPAALYVEDKTRLRSVTLAKSTVSTIAENPGGVRDPQPRPRRASVLFRDGAGAVWLANLDGRRSAPLKLAPGAVRVVRWAPDGKTFLYLLAPAETPGASVIREFNPDTGEDRVVSTTSSYATFSVNGDASVFVGASSSVAGPYVLLMVRSVRRELAVCEHRAKDPASVRPLFSPDSQMIFFQSDRHGKPAIYAMAVEKLVERTEMEEELSR